MTHEAHCAPLALAFVSLAALPAWTQQARPDAGALVELAWQYLPEYQHEQRAFLTAAEERDARAGAHLLQSALALDPDHLRGLWSLGQAQSSLAVNGRNRGDDEAARADYELAVAALSHAIELAPNDPWSLYARGAAQGAFADYPESLADFARAIEVTEAQLASNPDDLNAAQIRFRAMEWRTEVLMRSFEFERARTELAPFHAEFSENRFPLLIALSESYLRERDFASARATYGDIATEFPQDFQAYSLLGYLAGLLGDRAQASTQLAKAVRLESPPGVYTRLWYWLLATDEARPGAEEDLRLFLENPPPTLSDWDRGLGLFALGEGTVEAFLATARAEVERRMAAAEALDDLMCEVWFYAGARYEHDAASASDDGRRTLRERAFEAHREALRFSPTAWKWEWAFARVRFAALAQELGLSVEPGFAVADGTISGAFRGTVRDGRWHAPLASQPAVALERAPRPGDLFMGVLERAGEADRPLRLVVGALP